MKNLAAAVIVILFSSAAVADQPAEFPSVGAIGAGRYLVPTDQRVSIGPRDLLFFGRPVDAALNPSGTTLAVKTSHGILFVATSTFQVRQILPLPHLAADFPAHLGGNAPAGICGAATEARFGIPTRSPIFRHRTAALVIRRTIVRPWLIRISIINEHLHTIDSIFGLQPMTLFRPECSPDRGAVPRSRRLGTLRSAARTRRVFYAEPARDSADRNTEVLAVESSMLPLDGKDSADSAVTRPMLGVLSRLGPRSSSAFGTP